MSSFPSGTVTFLFTDIESSTKLAQAYPDQWEVLRERHNSILRDAMDAYNGYVFQIIGDAFCVAFHTASEGLNAAVDAQRNLQHEDWGETPIKVRMGLHTGSAEFTGKDYRGYVTMAKVQRVMSVACGGQVLLSNACAELAQNELPAGVALRDMKEHRLKGLPSPEHLWQMLASDLWQDFPALQSLQEIPNNLPTQLTSFVGRRKELEDLKRLLRDTHLLTLIGPGGTGKTRLSIQSAVELLPQYTDGACFVEFAPILDPLLVPRTTALAIGLRDEPQRPVIDMLCDYLHGKSMLILLDNCEHLVDACAQMADRILRAAPNVRILASSRESLGIAGEVTYRVPSLGLPDLHHIPSIETLKQYEAVKLFIDRALAAVSSFTVTNENAPALAQICHRLDGIPLAIELAAAKVRVLNAEQIATRLDDRFRLLTGGSRTALERHQTLRATIDWSYNLLPPNEQILFRRLSVFFGGWTLEAAEIVCSDTSFKSEEILELLEHLINKSMVIAEDSQHASRYRVMETMRQYANEKLVESGESDALRDRHLKYYLDLAETAEPHLIHSEQLEWLSQLDADYENLRAALEWALSKQSAEQSLRLCAALGIYWEIRTYWLEGSTYLERALAKPANNLLVDEKRARARAFYHDANLADQLDNFERMQSSAEASLALQEEGVNHLEIAISRYEVGFALFRRGDYVRARPLLEQSHAEFRELGDVYWQINSFKWLSEILVSQGTLKYSEKNIQTLELARRAGERLTLADALVEYANWLITLGKLDESVKYVEEANVLYKEIGSNDRGTASFVFAKIAWLNSNYEEAESCYMEMLERYGLIGEKNLRSACIALLGLLAMERGKLEQAQLYFEEALIMAREIGNKTFIGRRLAELAVNSYLLGNTEKCRQYYREGIPIAKELEDYHKRYVLLLWVNYIDRKELVVPTYILGAVDTSRRESKRPINPLNMRYFNRTEARIRRKLGDEAFASAFAEGHKMSLDEALDLTLKTVEEI